MPCLWTFALCGILSLTWAAKAPLVGLENPDRIPNDFIVLLKDLPGDVRLRFARLSTFVAAEASGTGTSPQIKVRQFVVGGLAAMRVTGVSQPFLQQLRYHKDVALVEANTKVSLFRRNSDRIESAVACVDQYTGKRIWGLSRISSRARPDYNRATYTHLEGDGQGVNAYVMDTGVLVTHRDIKGRAEWGYTADSFRKEGNVDQHGHGTHVAGIIAGTTYGVAKSTNIIAVKVLGKDGSGTIADVLEGAEWVYQDFQKKNTYGTQAKGVINMSLGSPASFVTTILEQYLMALSDNGLTVVVAAGNGGVDACMITPSRVGVAITVGASDINDDEASFSNNGPCVDILAPGDGIVSSFNTDDNATAIFSGTSMASPHVAGIVARLLSNRINRETPYQIKSWILDAASSYVLNMDMTHATPNKLLYMACVPVTDFDSCILAIPGIGVDDPRNMAEKDEVIFWLLIALGVLGFMTLVSLVSVCMAMSSSRSLTQSIGRLRCRNSKNKEGEYQKLMAEKDVPELKYS